MNHVDIDMIELYESFNLGSELMVDLIEISIRGQDQSDFREAIVKDLLMVLVFELRGLHTVLLGGRVNRLEIRTVR